MPNVKRFAGELFVGAMKNPPSKDRVVQAFDVDSTLTQDPYGPREMFASKDGYFDAARDYPPNEAVADLARLLASKGDHIAIATARPPERLQETIDWLERHNIPYDQVMHSTGDEVSGVAKQEMLQALQDQYKMVGTLFDDSPYNIQGARMQGVSGIHLDTNSAYWDAHPEYVYPYGR